MEYMHYLSAADLFWLVSPMLTTSMLGAASQQRWRRAGPAAVASIVIASAFALARSRWQASQPAALLVGVGLGSACAGIALIAVGRLPLKFRFVLGLATGTIATLLAPLAAVIVTCGLYSLCP
jgi:hypothetical protein